MTVRQVQAELVDRKHTKKALKHTLARVDHLHTSTSSKAEADLLQDAGWELVATMPRRWNTTAQYHLRRPRP